MDSKLQRGETNASYYLQNSNVAAQSGQSNTPGKLEKYIKNLVVTIFKTLSKLTFTENFFERIIFFRNTS